MIDFAADVRSAARALQRSPGFAFTAIATLAVGIGVNATVFTLANAMLFDGFPSVRDNDRIAYVASRTSACCLSYPDYRDWRAQATSFEDLAVVRGLSVSLSDTSDLPEGRDATQVSANTFALIGAAPLVGRDFAPADESPGAAPVAILSHAFWQRRYGEDPAVVGRVIRINGTPTTVIGVMPEGFAFPQKQDLWLPLVPTPELLQRDNRNLWFAFGRLGPGVTFASAQAEMDGLGRRLTNDYPLTNRDYMPEVRNFNEFFVGPNESAIYVAMWGAVAFVLLIACANLANLMLARATSRSRDLSLRIALGARPLRLVRELLLESLLLSAAGAAIGWWIARWAVQAYALADRGPGRTPWRVLDYTMDYDVFTYLVAVTIVTAILFGLAPARGFAKLDVNAALKNGHGSTAGGVSAKRLSAILVTTQVALAVVLLTGAGVMTRSYFSISTTDSGVRADNVLTGFVELPADRYPDAIERSAFFDRLRQRLEGLPGVESAAFASALPTWGARRVAYELADEPAIDTQRPTTAALVVSPAYFRTLGAPVRSGREFRDTDAASSLPVVMVNELFASRYWPGAEAIGKRVRLFDGNAPPEWLTVVGVAPNIVQSDTSRRQVEPIVYVPHTQAPRAALWVVLQTRVAQPTLAYDFKREVQALDADLPVLLGPYPLEERMAEVYWNNELYAILFLLFATIALLLAALGLYAVVAYSVSRHTREIGIRMAVGADARRVVSLVFRQGMLPCVIGLGIGLLASLGATRALQSMLAHVSPTDPVSFGVAAAVLGLAGALGCWIPARRATRVDPAVTLRDQ